MTTYFIVSLASGILFGIMDGLIHANSLARRLYEVYKPIVRTSFNPAAGILIDLFFGFVMATVLLSIYDGLPGETGLGKGVSFAFMAGFFRVVMSAASQWVMFTIPVKTLLYTILTGLGEMLVIGLLYGLTLKPV